MSTSPKKVEPILCVGPWQNESPDLPTTFQKACLVRIKLALQGWSLLCKDETCSAKKRLAPQGKEAGPHHYKKAPTFSQKVRVTNSSLALWSCKNISDLTFGGCLAGSTPVPLEGVSVLFSLAGNGHEHKDRASHWWTFRHHQLAPSVGKVDRDSLSHCRLPDTRVVWYSHARWPPPTTFKATSRQGPPH